MQLQNRSRLRQQVKDKMSLMPFTLSSQTLDALAGFDTCAVANAIESFNVRLRNEGYTNATIQCRLPMLPPMVGYAMTMRIRTASPSPKTGSYVERSDWWSQLSAMPVPHVLVVQDMDHDQRGAGAFIGEIHAAILQALGCVGAVTNGSVRDLPGTGRLGFRLFSGDVSTSHAYAHVLDIGHAVEIAGLTIHPGDLLHGDQHGIVRIPVELADRIPLAVQRLRLREQNILAYCRTPDFSIEGLQRLIDSSSHADSTPSATVPPS